LSVEFCKRGWKDTTREAEESPLSEAVDSERLDTADWKKALGAVAIRKVLRLATAL
jgi:hypothetical protein